MNISELANQQKHQGHQVAPAELEAHLLAHPDVRDCAVIPIADDYHGEVPKAFVVRTMPNSFIDTDRAVSLRIQQHVRAHKADYKRLRGGVEFIDSIPRSSSGKILRRILRDREHKHGAKNAAKL
jgi:acyl-coenzyme A synthetase/AMP-(fatty) acid ligase